MQAGDLQGARLNIERSLSLRTANDHHNSPWIAEAQIVLAECLIALGDQSQARSLLKQAATIQSAHSELGDHHKKLLIDAQLHAGRAVGANDPLKRLTRRGQAGTWASVTN